MIRVKTSELAGCFLDWAVAKAMGLEIAAFGERIYHAFRGNELVGAFPTAGIEARHVLKERFSPSRNWAQGGPLISAEQIATTPGRHLGAVGAREGWTAWSPTSSDAKAEGTTLLEAAMRCYVHCKLGPHVDVPPELVD